jgi:hypothetical protein
MSIIETRTKSSQNWSTLPGNFDVLHTSSIYPSDNDYGIPLMFKQEFVPSDLIMYGSDIRRPKKANADKTVHFFLDDYKFEPLWNQPNKTLGIIQTMGTALSPDFSLFTDYPIAIQIWNTYRNRWLARFWQDNGVQVIPTVVWSDEKSFDFCFKGIQKNSPVAVGTVGLRHPEAKKNFCVGFEEMCKQIEPSKLIVYGEIEPLRFEDYFAIKDVHRYETYWKKKRHLVGDK